MRKYTKNIESNVEKLVECIHSVLFALCIIQLYALFKQKYLVLKLTYFILILNSTFYCTIYIMNDKYKTEIRNTIH